VTVVVGRCHSVRINSWPGRPGVHVVTRSLGDGRLNEEAAHRRPWCPDEETNGQKMAASVTGATVHDQKVGI